MCTTMMQKVFRFLYSAVGVIIRSPCAEGPTMTTSARDLIYLLDMVNPPSHGCILHGSGTDSTRLLGQELKS